MTSFEKKIAQPVFHIFNMLTNVITKIIIIQLLPTQKVWRKKKKGGFQNLYFSYKRAVQNRFSNFQFEKKSIKLFGLVTIV